MVNVPKSLIAGETVSWTDIATLDEDGNDITSTDWTLSYYFRGAGKVDLVADPDGLGWVTATLADTFSVVGKYKYQAILTNNDDGKRVYHEGEIEIKADLSAIDDETYEFRTQAKQDLDAVQAAIRALATNAVKSYTIGTRSMTKIDLPELLVLESKLKEDVVREQRADRIAQGLGDPNKVMVRFIKA